MIRKKLVLVVDDEPAICWGFRQMLDDEGHDVLIASSAEQGLQLAREHHPNLIVLDVRLPGMDGLSALERFKAIDPKAPVIIMTAFGDLQTAVQAVHRGAADYLTKPFGIERARAVCRAALSTVEKAELDAEAHPGDEDQARPSGNRLVGRSQAMQDVYRKIAMVAESDLTVLITGETGTGKELIAAAIHENSHRHEQPYMAIAPVALNPTLIESELFGHVRGAFTGATENRQGLFELASGGTVFLDEIGELPAAIQVKLLRVLEQGEYTPVGDVRARRCDVRVIAATNVDLRTLVEAGEFREDLYFRLAGLEIHVPPLRDRLDDLEMLVQHFLTLYGHPQGASAIDPLVLGALRSRAWPGNVRELRNVVEHAAVMSRGGAISVEHLPRARAVGAQGEETQTLTAAVRQWAEENAAVPGAMDLLNQFLEIVEPTLLEVVLKQTSGNRAEAAAMLGIHRGTLRDRMRRYGLET